MADPATDPVADPVRDPVTGPVTGPVAGFGAADERPASRLRDGLRVYAAIVRMWSAPPPPTAPPSC
ncbi:hypothetical protein GCM10009601_01290 [Streptomyces thermospinosisporus]|uniref:Uncharacterized protein n=1 Tax=Streptomyces thermospinosisporus TaxID=161482 RepID=A0ABN1YIG2_9ACTN